MNMMINEWNEGYPIFRQNHVALKKINIQNVEHNEVSKKCPSA